MNAICGHRHAVTGGLTTDKYSFTPTHTCTHVFLVGFLLILGSILENVADSCSRLPPDYDSATAGSQIRSFFRTCSIDVSIRSVSSKPEFFFSSVNVSLFWCLLGE